MKVSNKNHKNVKGYIEADICSIEQLQKEEKAEYIIKNLDKVATSLKDAIKDNQKITIVGDYDVDGITASSILYLALTKLGAKVDIILPKRFSEGYGINENIVDRIDEGVLITVDNGIVAFDAIQKARDKGLYTIVTDHHMMREELPNAHLLIDPHIPDTADFENYCGAGIALKIAEQLELDKTFIGKLYSLAALGTIADMVELRKDNRKLVKEGFKQMQNGNTTLGTKVLLEKLNLSKENTPFEIYYDIDEIKIGFDIAPAINAPERIRDGGATLPLSILTRNDFIKDIIKNADDKVISNYESLLINTMISVQGNIIEIKKDMDTLIEEIELRQQIIRQLIETKSNEEEINEHSKEIKTAENKIASLNEKYKELYNIFTIKSKKIQQLNKELNISDEEYMQIKQQISKINNWCDKLLEDNEKRKELRNEINEKMQNKIDDMTINDEPMFPLIVYIENAPEGLIGLAAGNFAVEYETPTIIFTDAEDKNILKCSGRSACDINIEEIIKKINEKDPTIFEKFGGHESAFGASIYKEKFEDFKKLMNELCIPPLGYSKSDVIHADIAIEAKDMTKLLEEEKMYGPYGEGMPRPVYIIEKFALKSLPWAPNGVSFLGANKATLKLFGDNNTTAIGFNKANDFKFEKTPKHVTIVGQLGENTYKGKTTTQFMIQEVDDAEKLIKIEKNNISKDNIEK